VQINEKVVDDITILDITGEITHNEGSTLFKDKVTSLTSRGHTKIIFDLQSVPYIDDVALGEFVCAHHLLSKKGEKLKLLNVTKRVAKLLDTTKLDKVFELFEDQKEAIRSFNS
jgi:anti-sigma B factor antagonist